MDVVYALLADGVVLLHLAFIAFVLLGGLLLPARRWVVWLHAPCVVWGVWIELTGGICPLTPLENFLRRRAGEAAYGGDFVFHLVEALVYPAGLTPVWQVAFGVLVILVNLVVYGRLIRRWFWRRGAGGT